MSAYRVKRNERDWAGQLISWLKSAIDNKETIFQDATNDTSLRLESGKTKYPDILLFTDKISGIVFNGWELKFPDTPVDDSEMLKNALEKAKRLNSESFVTWNGTEAVIWKIDTSNYDINSLTKIKSYPKMPNISTRSDLSDDFIRHENDLKMRAMEILHDLGMLYLDDHLKPAINVSEDMIEAIRLAKSIIVPQIAYSIEEKSGKNRKFREEFNKWKIYESSTLSILEKSSRKKENIKATTVLANFTFYNLIGKILFYLTLSENLSGELERISISEGDAKARLEYYFEKAKAIDYQAVFQPYFTDDLRLTTTANNALLDLIKTLTKFDFRLLPSDVIGNILENLVPKDEKQKFGQYFTPSILASLVAYPAVDNKESLLMDPTSGTGTFLNSFYDILTYFGNSSHQDKLSRIWGNDISHFPAILSVINLYKKDVRETDNFPRVTREDFFNLEVGKKLNYPNPYDHNERIEVAIPTFDGIASNFPFIQQEDIPNDKLTNHFKKQFELTQLPFVRDDDFFINERADYFTYCVYNSIRFLKQGGVLSAITSNAWLGKEYGIQFKDFLLSNFHIKYVVRSTAEHWFSDSKVSAIYFVLEKGINFNEPTRFVTLNFKLESYFNKKNTSENLMLIEELYSQIDNCDYNLNQSWQSSPYVRDHYVRNDRKVEVSLVSRKVLKKSIVNKTNWNQYFIAENPLEAVDVHLIKYHSYILEAYRGERTGWNDMFVIPKKKVSEIGINTKYLKPYVKSPSELRSILFDGKFENYVLVCENPIEKLDDKTKNWIGKFVDVRNKNGSATIPEVCSSHKPFWYSLHPKATDITTAINPNDRLFFAYSEGQFAVDQRLTVMQVCEGENVELIAALLNSIVSLLTIELKGVSRNLGVLDLNANHLKEMRFLNPHNLSEFHKSKIIGYFRMLGKRPINSIFDEVKMKDRNDLDKAVFRAFGIPEDTLNDYYNLLTQLVKDRIEMKDR